MANATILVTVTPEPPAYHDIKSDQARVYAVHLTFGGEKHAVDTLLGNGPWSFTAYQSDGKRAADITTTVIASQTLIKDSKERLAAWLEKVSTFDKSPTEVGGTVELDGADSATVPRPNVRDVLHGSITWDAPLPQDLGLTYLVKCERAAGASWPTPLLILPTTSETLPAPKHEDGTVTFDVAGPDPVTLVTSTKLEAADLAKPLCESGFLTSTFSPDDHRLIEKLESKGASLIWMLPAFTGFLSAELRRLSDSSQTLDPHDLEKYSRIGCCLALDPLLLAIGAPKHPRQTASSDPKPDRAGVLLGGLAVEIDNWLSVPQSLNAVAKQKLVSACIDGVRSEANKNAEAPKSADALKFFKVPFELVDSLLPSPKDLPTLIDSLNALMAHFQQEAGLESALRAIIEEFRKSSTLGANQSEKGAISKGCQAYLDSLARGINAADAIRVEIGHRVLTEVLALGRTPADGLKASKAYLSRLEASPLAPCIPVTTDVSNDLKRYLEARWTFLIDDLVPATNSPARKRFHPDSVPQPLPISISTTADAAQLDDFTQRFNGIGVIIRSGDSATSGWTHANLAEFHPRLVSPPDQGSPYDSGARRVGLRTLLPVAVDGRREMFLRYRGFPLSSEAYRDTIRGAGDVSAAPSWRQAFYESHDLDYVAKGYARVPRLAYGNRYQWVAYAVTKGGSLPFILQKETAGAASPAPWLPKADLKDFNPPDAEVVGHETYRRRTAVGATTIVDADGQPPRIGIRYPEVYPLALDSPRSCISSINTKELRAQPFVDLFRNADGSGQLGTHTDDTWHLRLDGLLLDAKAAVEVVAELRGYGEHGEFVVSTGKSIASQDSFVEITLASPPPPPARPDGGGPGTADPPVSRDLWLRLRLEANTEAASLAFSPPSMTRSSAGAASQAGKSDPFPCNPDTPPVLLVGADSVKEDKRDDCWSPAFRKPTRANVVFPRTTWLDWEHWCGNRSLGMYGSPREPDASKDAYSIVDGRLLIASVLRALDDDINRLLDRLPDPSVSAVIAELTVIDAPLGTPVGSLVSRVIDIGKAVSHAFGKFNSSLASEGNGWVPQFSSALRELDKACRLPVEIRATKDGGLSMEMARPEDTTAGISPGLLVKIPEGTIARLSIRPFVPWPDKGHPAFHEGIKDLAIGEATFGFGNGTRSSGYVFEGASLTIEAMYDLPREQARDEQSAFLNRHIEITPIPQVRDYRVMFVPKRAESGKGTTGTGGASTAAETSQASAFPDPCRLFSHVEMRTQRWRFSGRPIYGWIKPKDFRKATATGDQTTDITAPPPAPAIELDRPDKLDDIKEFEAELFFDRDDADGEFTRVRLTGGRDELLACPWDLPSATYFRHAFNFVSRYAGAMQPGKGMPLWPRRQAEWSHRVAMLADAPRLEVTRPQMRCIVPLTTSPDAAEPATAAPDVEQRVLAPTAPVACILEERPFAVGGLAERMLGEIVTGVGYGFDSDGTDKRVHPLDFGKETSRDGRIAAWGWTPPTGYADQPSPARSFIVETEGPVGLHFEEVTTSAPAWSNCQYLLRPRSLRDQRPLPEESFLGVQLRRFLAPEWIFDAKKAESGPAPVRWPLHVPCIARHRIATMANSYGPLARVTLDESRGTSLIDFEKRGNDLVVFARRTLLGANYPDGSLPLCEIPLPPSGPAGDVALLHIPHGDGSFTISIAFVPPNDDAADGRANAPLIVGTARWTVAHLVATKPADGSGAATTPAAPTLAAAAPASGTTDSTIEGATLDFPSIGGAEPVVHATAMSQPTYREWTRTAKNADFVTAMTGTGDDRPIRVSGIRAKLTDEKEQQLEFRLSAGQDRDGSVPEAERNAIWLCGSLANSRMPLFVHRYLVGVFTSASTKGSRTYQSFAHASLLVGRRPRLPAATDNQIDSLTLHEMEVPASIVVGCKNPDLPANLEQFKVATIDLEATGGLADEGETIAYRLHVRFANSEASMRDTAATVQVMTPNRLMSVSVPAGVHAFDLMWTSSPPSKAPDPDLGQPFSVRFILWNCLERKTSPSEKCPTAPPDPKLPVAPHSIQVCIPSISSPTNTELWADVSLLHRRLKTPVPAKAEAFDDFTFDWLFSSRGPGDDRAAGTRTLATTLAKRTEAQGRFISSSQPIVIDPS